MESQATPTCPHCHKNLVKWANPELSSWSGAYQWVCFNDDCPYYVRGWEWMIQHFGKKASYRHRLDPTNGETGPLPVWSKDAMRSSIIEDGGESDG